MVELVAVLLDQIVLVLVAQIVQEVLDVIVIQYPVIVGLAITDIDLELELQ